MSSQMRDNKETESKALRPHKRQGGRRCNLHSAYVVNGLNEFDTRLEVSGKIDEIDEFCMVQEAAPICVNVVKKELGTGGTAAKIDINKNCSM